MRLSGFIICLLWASSIALGQPVGPTADSPGASSPSLPPSLGLAETVDMALAGAESAVAQVVVALAQVRSPVAMLKAKSSHPDEATALLQEVERLADVTMNVYQDAVLATSADVIMASAAATQALAILTQMRVNLTVAVAQLIVMREAQASDSGPDGPTMAQATTAQKSALIHVETARKRVESAMRATRDIELAQDTDERQRALQVATDAKRAVQAHAMAVSAYVLTILAHATNPGSRHRGREGNGEISGGSSGHDAKRLASGPGNRGATSGHGARPVGASGDPHCHGQ